MREVTRVASESMFYMAPTQEMSARRGSVGRYVRWPGLG